MWARWCSSRDVRFPLHAVPRRPASSPSSPPSGGITRGGRQPQAQGEPGRANEEEQDVDRSEKDRVKIFDTTLRDGEQSPGISLNKQEKLEIAHQLARLGADIIEAGFPITSPGDFEAVQAIAREVHGPVICGLARTGKQDIDAAWNAVKDSERPRIHTFIATSDIHIERKLQTTREDVMGQARAAVAHARQYTEDVEFSPEDGSRSDVEFMAEVIQIAIDEGATTINVPDTVGYTMPDEYAEMWARLYELIPDLAKVITSVHCHNDLGLAVANSFSGVTAGARQVECAINGIGERAGNASLEEIVMLLHTRESSVGVWTSVNTREIARTSRLVSRLTGYPVQPNKAIVGRNAFAHEAGIHQDGVLKERTTYEIMDATTIGLETNSIVLGKHSGRHALRKALEELGFAVDGAALNSAFKRFKELADKKKKVTALDLEAIVSDEMKQAPAAFEIESFEVEASNVRAPLAKVTVRMPDGTVGSGSFTGDGPVDAFFSAINAATGHDARLKEFHVSAVTGGRDALGEVTVLLELDGQLGSGTGVSTDILEASGKAYLRALSNVLSDDAVAEAERLLEQETRTAPAP
ncbi:MAG: 2-isopropylmalate synthase [Thermoleophilaceae bacterium]|nr:2-isopropylmalate synthase [Thermoleophilaceae bacterium]